LRGAACDILAEARAAIENPVNSDAEAVHDFRRAMKRWRALLRLIEPFLGTEARHMREEARDRSRRQSEPMLFEVGKRVQRRLSVARASQRGGKTAARPPRPASGPAHAGKPDGVPPAACALALAARAFDRRATRRACGRGCTHRRAHFRRQAQGAAAAVRRHVGRRAVRHAPHTYFSEAGTAETTCFKRKSQIA
jgi:hypothetical protein